MFRYRFETYYFLEMWEVLAYYLVYVLDESKSNFRKDIKSCFIRISVLDIAFSKNFILYMYIKYRLFLIAS